MLYYNTQTTTTTTTPVMVLDKEEEAVGIFTSKDLMQRTIAFSKDPLTTGIQDVMTPNPDCVDLETTILDALHLMHDGKFLHLPVLNDHGVVVGLTDVLQVSYGVVNQMGSLPSTTSAVGVGASSPVWSNFWNSMFLDDDSCAVQSLCSSASFDHLHQHNLSLESSTSTDGRGGRNSRNINTQQATVRLENGQGMESTNHAYPNVFVYKMVDAYGNNHRFTSSADSVEVCL